jgi:pyridoxal phosphate enzyme (YggS family)
MVPAEILRRWESILTRIDSARIRSGRESEPVKLIAVSKNQSVEKIQVLYQLGQRHFGENRLLEVLSKREQLPNDIVWRMIGHLQSNKAKLAVNLSCLDSLDSVSTVRTLSKALSLSGGTMEVLLEFCTSDEETKHGIRTEQELIALLEALADAPQLHPRGLMTMAPQTTDQKLIRESFRKLRSWQDYLIRHYPGNWSELSMGMSGDFEIAIEEGSTMVRIGTALLGPAE